MTDAAGPLPDLDQPERLAPTFRDQELQRDMERYGYVVAPAIGPASLERLREAHRRIGHAPDDPRQSTNWSFHSRSSEHKRAVHRALLELLSPTLDELFDDHVAYLATFITKWPGTGSAFAPHQDPTLVDERAFRGVTVWIPLEDTLEDGVDMGTLHVVPGSHRFSASPRVQDVDDFEFSPFEDDIVRVHGRAVPTRAGDVLVFDNRVIHYSWPNGGDRPRVVASFTLRPRETTPVLLRRDGEGRVDLFRIHDDLYLDVLPAEQHLWNPPTPAEAKLDVCRAGMDSERFATLCSLTPEAPGATIIHGEESSWVDPPAVCHLCGSADDLDPADREGRNNAQLVCTGCRTRLEQEANPPSEDVRDVPAARPRRRGGTWASVRRRLSASRASPRR